MPFTSTSTNNIKVGYVSKFEGYISGLTIQEANDYENLSEGTTFIFVDGDGGVRYLTIDQVNQLTTDDLKRKKACDVGPKSCGPPNINFFGGGGIGVKGNPVIDRDGNILAVDIVDGGYGYTSPPQIRAVDLCNNGSGAVLVPVLDPTGVITNVIVEDSGSGYLPSSQGEPSPQYPVLITLTDVIVKNPGLNYDPNDTIIISPNNGTNLSFSLDPFGKVNSVKVNKGGNFTSLPDIFMDTDAGVNAQFTPVFGIVRDPLVPQIADPGEIVQVYDLIGLQINGYVDGKAYYGNVFFDNGIKYAGVRNTGVIVYETLKESITKDIQPKSTTSNETTDIDYTETTDQTDTSASTVVRSTGTRQTAEPTTTPITTTTTTTSTSSGSSSSSGSSGGSSSGGGGGGGGY